MKRLMIFLILIVTVIATSCVTSTMPLYDQEKSFFDKDLEGVWVSTIDGFLDNDTLVVEPVLNADQGTRYYKMSMGIEESTEDMKLQTMRMNNTQYFNLSHSVNNEDVNYWGTYKMENDQLLISIADHETVKEILEIAKDLVYTDKKDVLRLESNSQDLILWISRHRDEIFTDYELYTKISH